MGISAAIGGIIDAIGSAAAVIPTVGSALAAGAAGDIGLGGIAGEIGTAVSAGLTGAETGAALGGVEAGLTGQNIVKGIEGGAEGGAITGGLVSTLGPALQAGTGLSPGIADALVGAGAGALGSTVTGSNPLISSATGALQGSTMGGQNIVGGPSAGSGGGGGAASAAGTAAPSGLGAGVSAPDLNITGSGASNLPGDFTTNTGALPGGFGAGAAGAGGAGQSGLTPNIPSPTPIQTPQLNFPSGLTTTATGSGLTPPSTTAGGGTNNFVSAIEKNPIPALALGADLLAGNRQPAEFGTLQTEANQLAKQGTENRNYLESGTLPPGQQATLNAAGADAAASIRAEYAARGMSGSSAEVQDLSSAAQRIQAQGEQLAAQLFSSGVSETNAADQIYANLMNVQMQEDAQLSNSIGRLVGSFAGAGQPFVAATGG